MKRLYIYIFILLIFLTVNTHTAQTLQVLCTTSQLSAIVKSIGKDKVSVSTIIPYGMCPGHFDISPSEIISLNNTDIVLYHGFERFIENLISDRNKIQLMAIDKKNNLMIPRYHIQASEKITGLLNAKCIDSGNTFFENLKKYRIAIKETETEIKNNTAALENTPVICSQMNREFVEWLGLNIIAVFPRDEDISLKSMHDIVIKAKRSGAKFVIDNLQSSGNVGKSFAEDLEIPLIMISNFPENDDYIKSLRTNCDIIIGALQKDSSSR